MIYTVQVRSIVEEWVEVEADSKSEAREKARHPAEWRNWEEGSRIVLGPWPALVPVEAADAS
jgi:hypothetical protein